MSKVQLEAAKEFMFNKQYDIARTILQALPEDETAKTWLTTLNKNTLSPPNSHSIKDASDKHLCETIVEDQSFSELFLRLFGSQNRRDNSKELSELLCDTLRDDDKDHDMIERSCYLLSLVDSAVFFNNKDRDIIAELGTLLVSDIGPGFSRSEYVRSALRKINTPQAKIQIISTPLGVGGGTYKFQKLDREQIKLRNDPNLVADFRMSLDGKLLFSMHIIRNENKQYKILYPGRDILIEHMYLVVLVLEIAEHEIMMHQFQDDWQEEQAQGEKTYYEDIAPYDDDNELRDAYEQDDWI